MMKHSDRQLLEMAVEITKEYSRGGGDIPDVILERIYKQLKELNDKMKGTENR